MFKAKVRLGCFALVLALSSVTGVSADSYSNDNRTSTSTAMSNQELSVSDQELIKTIREKLASEAFLNDYKYVNVQVKGGVVTLQGSVQTQADKDKVEKKVSLIDGVKSVKNNLKINNK